MSWDKRVLARLLIAGVLAGAIGELSLSGQWGPAVNPPLGQGTRASPEMMQLVRDEHNLVADMVKAQLAILGSDVDSKPIAAAERRQVIAMR
jgi:hypothetical protein